MSDESKPTPKIVIQEKGPYEVTGDPVLTKRAQSESIHGEPLEWDLIGTEDADYKRRAATSSVAAGSRTRSRTAMARTKRSTSTGR